MLKIDILPAMEYYIVLLYLYCMAYSSDGRVIWTISKLPVVFGRDIKLICKISDEKDCCYNLVRTWFGGPEDNFLSINGIPTNASKYKTYQDRDEFTLIIQNLSQEDVNKNYRCSYGTSDYTDNLRLNSSFESHPSIQDTKSSYRLENQVLNVKITYEDVHPIPKCFMWFQGKEMSSNLTTQVMKVNPFFNAEFDLSYIIDDMSCSGVLVVKCRIGLTTHLVINETIYNQENGEGICKLNNSDDRKEENTRNTIIFSVAAFFSFVTFITLIGVFIAYHSGKRIIKAFFSQFE